MENSTEDLDLNRTIQKINFIKNSAIFKFFLQSIFVIFNV